MNPVRASMVVHQREYAWSSYAANGEGKPNVVITPHDLVEQLGTNDEQRRQAYVQLFKAELDADVIAVIRAAASTGNVLGHDRFKEEVALITGKRVTPNSRGRKRKDANGPVEGEQVGFGF